MLRRGESSDLPLNTRIIRSCSVRKQSRSLFMGTRTWSTRESRRPLQYRSWGISAGRIQAAVEEIRRGKSVRTVAEEYGIPKSTFGDYASGRVIVGAKQGHGKVLTDVEEEALVSFIVGCGQVGFGKSIREVIALTTSMAEAKGLQQLSVGWWDKFRRRHGEKLTVKAGESLSRARLAATDPDILDRYYDLLETTLLENNLIDKPMQIFNLDESGMPLGQKSGKIVGGRGEKHTYVATSGDKSQITVLACTSATGVALPPLVIFDRKGLNPQWTIGEVPGTTYGLTDKGWIDTGTFESWFTHHFLMYAPAARPLLVLLDGHSSHYGPAVIRLAAEENVIIFCLPPNTTHLLQPLDRSAFGSLKVYWKEECHKYTQRTGKFVTRNTFSTVFATAWSRAMTIENITAGFRATGVYPFDRKAVRLPTVNSSPTKKSFLSKRVSLAFVPMISPSVQRRKDTAAIMSPHHYAEMYDKPTETTSVKEDYVPRRKAQAFTEIEDRLYRERYENGYDLTHDGNYNAWLKENGLQAPVANLQPLALKGKQLRLHDRLVDCSRLPSLLRIPPLPQKPKPPVSRPVDGKVLTSAENILLLEEKAKKKKSVKGTKQKKDDVESTCATRNKVKPKRKPKKPADKDFECPVTCSMNDSDHPDRRSTRQIRPPRKFAETDFGGPIVRT